MKKCILCPGRNVIPAKSEREKWQDHTDRKRQKNSKCMPVRALLGGKRKYGAERGRGAGSRGDTEHHSENKNTHCI